MSGATDVLTVEQIRAQLEAQLDKARAILELVRGCDWNSQDQALSDLADWVEVYLKVSRPPP